MFKQLSSLFFMIIFMISCKTEHQDAEQKFVVTFYSKETGRGSNYCFDKVYGMNQNDLVGHCVDSSRNYLELPLDIKTDSVLYIFQKQNVIDTLILRYSPKLEIGDGKYIVDPGPITVGKHTFDSLQVECKFENHPHCEIENIYIFL